MSATHRIAENTAKTQKTGYEYVVLACCFMFLFVNVGFISTTFNVFQPHITEIIGDSLGSMVLFVRNLSSFAAMLFVASYYEKLDCRLGVSIATGFSAAGLFVYAQSSVFPLFCVGAVLTGIGYGFGGAVAMTLLVGRWFAGRTGTALGIATMGSGLAAIVMPICVSTVVEAFSLSAAFLMEAAIAVVVGLLCFVLVRNNPPAATGDASAKVDAESCGAAGADAAPAQDLVGECDGAARAGKERSPAAGSAAGSSVAVPKEKGRSFIVLAAMACLGVISLGGTTYIGVLLTTSGFDATFAARIIAIGGVTLFVSKFLTGLAFDKLGTRRATALFFCFLLAGTAAVCFAGAGSVLLVIAAVVSLYFGVSLATVGISQWSLMLSDARNRSKTVRNFQLFYTAGGFLCMAFPGVLMDALGTYAVSYAIFAFFGLVSMVIVLRTLRCAEKL